MSGPAHKNDLEAMRRIFNGGQGERPSHNTALQLCDEVERLRARLNVALQLAVALDGGGLTTHARMDLMRRLQTVCSGRAAEPEPEGGA